MSLHDVLSYAEMEKYFLDLPENVREQLIENQHIINSSNDLYIHGERLLSEELK